ncbi:Eukaryotic translation initiation factor 3 subunit D [Echinococcus granulosus]|uniref:Eukaryotic translation initiation factor 3 subunit D n=1 Tax=Echinococcus granulosus TaxID=6210 RepID=U6JFN4_ECHGR|nr:Eukaryotic translation initiation factor 3 subunit D [Echinococcus granulosus]EUB60004.1 Eukaryotic translation initiation factor 3 subunit D [Echinococcus granulosus]CDS20565.1 eukaryotic translation initiation factor 3 [Echinococcus granulosus]
MSVVEEVLPSFGDLSINSNSEGWGPSNVPTNFKDMPYQPFSKDTRLGKIADWCGTIYPDLKSKNRYVSQFGGGAQYTYYHDEDDSNFQLATSGKEPKSSAFRQRFRYQMRGRGRGNFQSGFQSRGGGQFMSLGNFAGRQRRPLTERERAALQQQQQQRRYGNQPNWQNNWRRGSNWGSSGGGGGWRQGNDYNRRPNRGNRNPSVEVKEEWNLLEDFEFSQFVSLSLPSVKEPITCAECGTVKYYDRTYDTISTRSEKPLVRFNGVVHAVTTSEDPVIMNLARERHLNVFCTDRIAAAIMCAPKSVDSWDLLAIRIADKLFFDVRPGSNFDHVTVAETAIDPPSEEPGHINSPEKLALEATFININFSQQVLQTGGELYNFKHKNPFIDSDDKEEAERVASVGYRYRQFDLGNGINMVVRCEVDAVMPLRAEEKEKQEAGAGPDVPKFCCIKALNEFDSRYCNGVNWRTKLDTQRGAVIASELKNNSCKLAKWTVASILAGADLLKFGFVSRVNPKDTSHHAILGTHEFRPTDFAAQINLNMDNAWGILRCVIDYFMKCEPGTYLMLKDPNKQSLHIYFLPANAFASDEESDESSEEQNAHPQPQTAQQSQQLAKI